MNKYGFRAFVKASLPRPQKPLDKATQFNRQTTHLYLYFNDNGRISRVPTNNRVRVTFWRYHANGNASVLRHDTYKLHVVCPERIFIED